MAKKTLEDQIAEHEAAIQKLRDEAAAAYVTAATDKKAALQDALEEFNAAAKLTGGRVQPLRLSTDAERAGKATGGSGGGSRLRLKPEQVEALKTEIVKAAKAYKSEGAARAQIVERLTSSNVGLVDGKDFNDGFVTRYLADLKADGTFTTVGSLKTMRYVAAK